MKKSKSSKPKVTKKASSPSKSTQNPNRVWLLVGILLLLLVILTMVQKKKTMEANTVAPVQQQQTALHMTSKPANWKSYNLGATAEDGVSFYVPPAGQYCNGCVDGRKEGTGTLTVLSGGYDTASAPAGWRLFIFEAPIGDTSKPQEFANLKQTKTVQQGSSQFMFGFESYDAAHNADFDTISASIMMGHRDDGEMVK